MPTCCLILLGILCPDEQMRPGCIRVFGSKELRLLAPVRVDVLQRLGIGMLERVESRQAQALGDDKTRCLRADGWSSCKDGAGQ